MSRADPISPASALAQMNGAVAGADGKQAATAVDLAMDLVLANLAFGGYGHVEIDVAVAGVKVDVCGKIAGYLERDAAIAGFEPPVRGQRRARSGANVDMTVTCLEFEFIETSVGPDVTVAGGGVQLAIHVVEAFGAIAAVQIHLALESGEFDPAVSGAQVDVALARHLDDDIDAMISPLESDVVVGIAHIDFDGVAGLALVNVDPVFPDLVAAGDDLGFDRVLIPGGDANVGVGCLDAQVRLARELVGFRPFIGAGRHNRQDH